MGVVFGAAQAVLKIGAWMVVIPAMGWLVHRLDALALLARKKRLKWLEILLLRASGKTDQGAWAVDAWVTGTRKNFD